MRLGVLADVHANLHALEAVLARLAAEAVDAYVCAGDLVGYGPLPNEVVARVAGLGGWCVAGNHDLMALGALSSEGAGRLARESAGWTAAQVSPDTQRTLRELPLQSDTDGLVVTHGAFGDPARYVRSVADAQEQLAQMARASPAAELLVLGHTHVPFAAGEHRGELLRGGAGTVRLEPGERHVLNPGSVGQSRSRRPHARVLVLDLERREAVFHAVSYDVRGCRAALRRQGLPASSCHLSPSLPARLRRRAVRLARDVRLAPGDPR